MERKEAIEIVRKLYNESLFMKKDKEAMVTLIPELKESEDERIRKEIINYLKSFIPHCDDELVMKSKSWIAWLEKQGKETSWKPSKEEMDVLYGLSYITNKFDERKEEVITRLYQDLKREFFNGASFENMFSTNTSVELEKQGKQNPADNVKPKFKVGNWITNGEYTWKVTAVYPSYYILQSPNGDMVDDTTSYVNEHFHLWTIQDAKDGDVLVLNNDVFIYAHRKQMYSIAVAHCFVNSAGSFHFDGEFGYKEFGKAISPATQEQRDFLFSKMEEAGYEWDSETKKIINNND